MFPGVYASTSHVHACSLACTSARGPCTHVLRRASQHEPRARMFSGVHVSTRLMHACSPACMSARGSCTHVLRRASDPGDSREFWTGDLPGGEQAASISKTSFPRWKRRSQQYIPWRAAGDNSAPSGICRNGIVSARIDPGSEQAVPLRTSSFSKRRPSLLRSVLRSGRLPKNGPPEMHFRSSSELPGNNRFR